MDAGCCWSLGWAVEGFEGVGVAGAGWLGVGAAGGPEGLWSGGGVVGFGWGCGSGAVAGGGGSDLDGGVRVGV